MYAHTDPEENNTMLEMKNIHIINKAAAVAATIINDNGYYLLLLLNLRYIGACYIVYSKLCDKCFTNIFFI